MGEPTFGPKETAQAGGAFLAALVALRYVGSVARWISAWSSPEQRKIAREQLAEVRKDNDDLRLERDVERGRADGLQRVLDEIHADIRAREDACTEEIRRLNEVVVKLTERIAHLEANGCLNAPDCPARERANSDSGRFRRTGGTRE